MAIQHHQQNNTHFPQFDTLFCEEEEEQWDIESDETLERESGFSFNNPTLIESDELFSLFSKERETQIGFDPDLSIDRRSAVEWMIRVNSRYGFAALTSILAVDYFDRFVSMMFELEREKPWMIQLAAVTCLSLAAKVEETQVPLLLDFQVEGAKYAFEAKTIQRMELMVLSTLKWKMNPVTPLSFIDHIIITNIGLKSHLLSDFLRLCETLLLSLLPDSRFNGYMPSVLATSAMLHVIEQVEPFNHAEYQNQLLSVLNLTWEKVNDCYQLIADLSNTSHHNPQQNKRKYEQISTNLISSSSAGDSTSDQPNHDMWTNGSSVSSSQDEAAPHKKKIRATEQRLRVPSLSRGVFVDVLGSSR